MVVALPDVAHQDGRGIDIVDRDIEESLNLIGMQIHGQDPVDPDHGKHVGDHASGDGHTSGTHAAILAGITEIGNGCGDAPGRSAAQGIHHQHDLHQAVVGGRTSGLKHEDVLAAHILQDFHVHFAIGEAAHGRASHADIEVAHDILG